MKLYRQIDLKEYIYNSVANYNYVESSKVSVSIKRTNANKCTLSKIFPSEIDDRIKREDVFKAVSEDFSNFFKNRI